MMPRPCGWTFHIYILIFTHRDSSITIASWCQYLVTIHIISHVPFRETRPYDWWSQRTSSLIAWSEPCSVQFSDNNMICPGIWTSTSLPTTRSVWSNTCNQSSPILQRSSDFASVRRRLQIQSLASHYRSRRATLLLRGFQLLNHLFWKNPML